MSEYIILKNNNLFWRCAWYRSKLTKRGIDIEKYVNKDGYNLYTMPSDCHTSCISCIANVCSWK